MKIKEVLNLINSEIISRNNILSVDDEINNVTTNLQKTTATDIVFYKIKNTPQSIEAFQERLNKSSPGLIIINRGMESVIKNDNCLFIDSESFLKVQKILLDVLFPNKNKLKIVGVTGTNGKTTTVNLAMQISSMLGHPAISVGTIGIQDANGELVKDLESTTPSYVEMRKIINLYQDKYQACFVEVSSHALDQNRLFDISLDSAAWTSFSQDHLDYHKSMDEYFEAKLLIERKFLKPNKTLIVPVLESALFETILKKHPNARLKKARSLEELKIKNLPLFYRSTYNLSNVECAIQMNCDLWGEDKVSEIDLTKIKTPMGRFSVIEMKNNSMAIIDYAHTPDALINIGIAIKNAFPGHKITVVFGCGGNRDKTKRPLMAKAVESFASKVVVTSDNPRDEAPEDIIIDIINGFTNSYEAVVDRKKAINYALESMESNEIVLIAGKGHEEYQEIKGVKHPFSDFLIVKDFNK